jgi:hypothetical protein
MINLLIKELVKQIKEEAKDIDRFPRGCKSDAFHHINDIFEVVKKYTDITDNEYKDKIISSLASFINNVENYYIYILIQRLMASRPLWIGELYKIIKRNYGYELAYKSILIILMRFPSTGKMQRAYKYTILAHDLKRDKLEKAIENILEDGPNEVIKMPFDLVNLYKKLEKNKDIGNYSALNKKILTVIKNFI